MNFKFCKKGIWPVILLCATCVFSAKSRAETSPPAKRPFPQAEKNHYSGNSCSYTPAARNKAVEHFYNLWKKKYLKPARTIEGGYKVSFNKQHETVSEAIGYGMLIVVQMAGYDPEAKTYFDGLNRFRKSHPSQGNKAFMSWRVDDRKKKREHSATDGDVDMAMALLMAEQQWGDATYRKEAKKIIDALLKDLIRKDGSIRLGDWQQAHGNDSPASTRTSDFEIASFRTFYRATGNDEWLKVVERCFTILNQLQADYAPKTGLLPDFALQQKDGTWKPAHPKFLEGHNDGNYGYNACRVPWRIGFSAIYSNDEKSKKIAKRLMNWIVSTHASPAEFKAGYKLDGTPTTQSSKMVFTAPTGVAAMASENRDWLDGTFRLAAKTTDSYFNDSVNLICLLIMSENYWSPEY